MKNEERIDEEIRRRLEQTATRPTGAKPPHEHRYMVTVSNMTAIRWCMACGKSWRMVAIQKNFQQKSGWQEIYETE